MNIWQFLKERMLRYSEKTAFWQTKMTYAQCVAEVEKRMGEAEKPIAVIGYENPIEQTLHLLAALGAGSTAVPVTNLYGGAARQKIERELTEAPPENCAIIAFSSGTLGRPKGIMLSHKGIVENMLGISSYFPLDGGDRIMIARPLVHMAVLTGELFYALWRGAEICFYSESFNPTALLRLVSAAQCTAMCATPTIFYHMAKSMRPGLAATLRTCCLSGEMLSGKTAAYVQGKLPGAAFYHVYGLTENSPRVSALDSGLFLEKPGCIGKPLPNTEWKLEEGELLVRSPSVMLGYYRDPWRTKQAIQEDGWLHTGDLAFFDEEGDCFLLGRKDDMIIRAGLNIYPAEIVKELLQDARIELCQVYGVFDENYGQKICAEIVGEITEKEVRALAVSVLPAHMVPTQIKVMEKADFTPSGKLARAFTLKSAPGYLYSEYKAYYMRDFGKKE